MLDGAPRTRRQLSADTRRAAPARAAAAAPGGGGRDRAPVLSYPRLDVAEARVRVPSFYALDVLRGATGLIPDPETLAEAAAQAGDATLAWPAPGDPAMAIDDQEHDLAVLRPLLDRRDPSAVRGHAQYLLRLNPALRRSVTERWARGQRRWSQFDGLTRVADGIREPLARYRLGARPYSLSALQRFSVCPYQFVLSAVYRRHLGGAAAVQVSPADERSARAPYPGRVFPRARPARSADGDAGLPRPALAESPMSQHGSPANIASGWSPPSIGLARRELPPSRATCGGWVRRVADEGADWIPKYSSWPSGCGRTIKSAIREAFRNRRNRRPVHVARIHRSRRRARHEPQLRGRSQNGEEPVDANLVIGGGAVLQRCSIHGGSSG